MLRISCWVTTMEDRTEPLDKIMNQPRLTFLFAVLALLCLFHPNTPAEILPKVAKAMVGSLACGASLPKGHIPALTFASSVDF